MDTIRVSLSAMTAAGYDPIRQRIKIQLKQGTNTYDFWRVPRRVYDGLMMAAASKGGYCTAHIRGRYQRQSDRQPSRRSSKLHAQPKQS